MHISRRRNQIRGVIAHSIGIAKSILVAQVNGVMFNQGAADVIPGEVLYCEHE
jgi:hypothetical protein